MSRLSGRVSDRGVQIHEEVFDAHGNAHHLRNHTGRELFLLCQLLMGRTRRMNDERLGRLPTFASKLARGTLDRPSGNLVAALQTEPDHAAVAALDIPTGAFVGLVALESRVVHPGDMRIVREVLHDGERVLSLA
jgi:hypothetical protein